MAVVDVMVEGGKAAAGATMGSALGPLGVNIGEIVTKINEKTRAFAGMKVPVKVIVDEKTKTFEIEVGTPPASALIIKELGIEKGGSDQKEKAANATLAQIVKVAKMKEDSLLGKELKTRVKEILGTCVSMGVRVDSKDPRDVQKEIDQGKHDSELK